MIDLLKGGARRLSGSPVLLRMLVVGRLLVPLGTLLAVLITMIGMGVLLYFGYATGAGLAGPLLVCGALAIAAILVGSSRLHSQLLKPLLNWRMRLLMCAKGHGRNLPLQEVGVLGSVTRDLDGLSGELIDLYEEWTTRWPARLGSSASRLRRSRSSMTSPRKSIRWTTLRSC